MSSDQWLDTNCSVCGLQQFNTAHGTTCENGHGGADGVPRVGLEPHVEIDLETMFWNRIKEAAAKSRWIPPDYFMNHWVEDVCTFLEYGPKLQPLAYVVAEFEKDPEMKAHLDAARKRLKRRPILGPNEKCLELAREYAKDWSSLIPNKEELIIKLAYAIQNTVEDFETAHASL